MFFFCQDLKTLLDNSKDGVVYMNFGSNVRSSELPVDKKNAFLNVFRRLNQTVLWKWEDENLENKPKNLVTSNWFPQKEIFGKYLTNFKTKYLILVFISIIQINVKHIIVHL